MSSYPFKKKFLTTFSLITNKINDHLVRFTIFMSILLFLAWEFTKFLIATISRTKEDILFFFQIQELANSIAITLLIVFFVFIFQKREFAYIENLSIMHNGIIKSTVNNKKYLIEFSNHKVSELLKYSDNGLIGKDLREIFNFDGNLTQIKRFLDNPEIETIKNIETVMLTSKNDKISVLLTAFRSYSFNNKEKGLFIVVTDIQQQKKAQEQLQQVKELEKETIISNLIQKVGHEINNPLTYLQMDTERLIEYINELNMIIRIYNQVNTKLILKNELELDSETKTEMIRLNKLKKDINLDEISTELEGILSSTKLGLNRIAEVVKEVRDFPFHHTEKTKQDFNKIINLTIGLVKKQYIKENLQDSIRFELNLSKNLPNINVKPGEIGQLLLNVILNSIYAIDTKKNKAEKGKILIETKIVNLDDLDSVCLIIEDNGVGINSKNIKEIFQPYYTSKKEGTGLGLTLVRKIVDNHQGTIEVTSERGMGTKFQFLLPVLEN